MGVFSSIRSFFARLRKDPLQRELEDLQKQAALTPNDERAMLRLAEGFVRTGQAEHAVACYWRAVEVFQGRNDTQKASAVLKRLVALKPQDILARAHLARAFETLQRRREASQQYECVGFLQAAAGAPKLAIAAFEKALSLDPANGRLSVALSKLRPPLPAPGQGSIPKIVPFVEMESTVEPTRDKPILAKIEPVPVTPVANASATDAATPLDPVEFIQIHVDIDATERYEPTDLLRLVGGGEFNAATILDAGNAELMAIPGDQFDVSSLAEALEPGENEFNGGTVLGGTALDAALERERAAMRGASDFDGATICDAEFEEEAANSDVTVAPSLVADLSDFDGPRTIADEDFGPRTLSEPLRAPLPRAASNG